MLICDWDVSKCVLSVNCLCLMWKRNIRWYFVLEGWLVMRLIDLLLRYEVIGSIGVVNGENYMGF